MLPCGSLLLAPRINLEYMLMTKWAEYPVSLCVSYSALRELILVLFFLHAGVVYILRIYSYIRESGKGITEL